MGNYTQETIESKLYSKLKLIFNNNTLNLNNFINNLNENDEKIKLIFNQLNSNNFILNKENNFNFENQFSSSTNSSNRTSLHDLNMESNFNLDFNSLRVKI